MSGTNTICVATVLLETGMLPMHEPVTEITLEAPAGLIRIRATCAGGKVTGVTFRNVPAFATHLDTPIEVPRLGTVVVDVAYGGMFYVIADAAGAGIPPAARRGPRHHPGDGDDQGRRRRAAAGGPSRSSPASQGITIGQLSGPAHDPRNSWRNVVTVSTGTLDWERPSTWTGVIDRSPCGTGHLRQDGRAPREGAPEARRGLPARGDPRNGVHRAESSRRRGSGTGPRSCRRSPGPPGSRASRRTSSIPPTRFPRGTRSATSGSAGAQARAGASGTPAPGRRVISGRGVSPSRESARHGSQPAASPSAGSSAG